MSSVTHTVGKSLYDSDSGKNQIFWRTNFNMPVQIPGGEIQSVATSFDLSGFVPGLEICVAGQAFSIDWPVYGDVYIKMAWCNPSGVEMYSTGENMGYFSINSGQTWSWPVYYLMNIGCASWEIATTANYYIKTTFTGAFNFTQSTPIYFYNVPSVATTGTPGMIYVDGNYLSFINANNFLHRMLGTDQEDVEGTPGYIWIDTSNNLSWISSDGHKRISPWKIKQSTSYANPSVQPVNAGTSKAGYIWMDTAYWYTHIAYIGYDGYKYICGAGDYPY